MKKPAWLAVIAVAIVVCVIAVLKQRSFFAGSVVAEQQNVRTESVPPTINNAEQLATDSSAVAALTRRLVVMEQALDTLREELRLEQQSTLALQSELLQIRNSPRQQSSEELLSASGEEEGVQALTTPLPDTGSTDTEISNELAMLAAGVDPDTAREITARMDQYTLAQLEVRDTASREGWLDSDDYAQRSAAALPEPVDIRAELGDDVWEQYLYSIGRANRVRVASVLAGSAADTAGLKAGDLLLSYAGNNVFTTFELQRATREGERGEPVNVRLDRAGSILDVSIPRGPLGVTLSPERRGS